MTGSLQAACRVVARRLDTPTRETGRGPWIRLFNELLDEKLQRLALFALVGFGLWTFGLLMDLVFLRQSNSTFVPASFITSIEIGGMAASVLLFAYVRYASHDGRLKDRVGIAYMLLCALGVAMINIKTGVPVAVPAMHLSWNAVVILVFAMIMWTKPLPMLYASLAAASMDPLGVWIASLRGLPVPSLFDTFVLYLPSYACAFVAPLPALVLSRLGQRLDKAQELGSYALVELLGQGGMGEVWRAEHRLLSRSAAIKLVRPELLGTVNDEESRLLIKRFEREARATSALSSPHTIHVFDFGVTDEGRFYYVMELLAGRDVESLVRAFGPLPADRTIFLLRQVCHSLADAHARGLVHQDVKPANIYVCRMGLEYDFVKVLDFGLVKFKDRAPAGQNLVTVDRPTTGTPAYMAPEIILGETDVDRRADVYALGCVAYYMLTGQLVFEADTPMKMFLQHVQATPVPPSQRTELAVPSELDDLVLACLEKDPAKRPQNAIELFDLACDCRSCDGWGPPKARRWWETHLPDLSGPLAPLEPGVSATTRLTAYN